MKVKIAIGGTEFFITPDQYDTLIKVLDGAEAIDTIWVGANKGFYGNDKCYTIDLRPFNPETDARAYVTSDFEYDKLYTLCAMRRAAQTEEE